jgi:hypothetical protein
VLALWLLQRVGHLDQLAPDGKPSPDRHAGWREVGVAAQMLIEVGSTLGVPVYVLHNDHKIHEFVPEGWAEQGQQYVNVMRGAPFGTCTWLLSKVSGKVTLADFQTSRIIQRQTEQIQMILETLPNWIEPWRV